MHVVVIGAGVIGVTTAYYLSELGCQVTVIDRATGVAGGASYGNAGQLSYSFTDALARPEFVSRIPGIVAGRDLAYRTRLSTNLVPWGLRFLAQCTSRRAEENTVAVLKMAMRSDRLMQRLRKRLPFNFSYQPAGKLVLLGSHKELHDAEALVALKKAHGCETEILGPKAAIDIEPALADVAEEFIAAIYSRRDSVADSYSFSVGLMNCLEKSGRVSFRFGDEVTRLKRDRRRLRVIELRDGELPADAIVVCTGAWSGKLLGSVGVNPHIYPVRGYSLTLPPGDASPAKSVTVLGKKIVFSRIAGNVRIAGFADFKGFRTDGDAQRIDTLLEVARGSAPYAADYSARASNPWGGFRPMTPNGRPWVGPSGIDGLYLNTGHGMLGWTLACASGYDVARSVASNLP
ncbi:MAG: FAD-dependent oxidoreductase [Gammaproteobacteria bacterium]|nr:FAD-dependent oxidoreductase [Gammaproteobacteria bacterium]